LSSHWEAKEIILELKEELGFMLNSKLLIPKIKEEDARRNKFATIYWESRNEKEFLYDAQKPRKHFAAMMVNGNAWVLKN
jgi:malate dehydrogenase (oxaloacetate-decarboxylating)(NADP+)